jgi:hypothetical protein
MRWFDYAYIVLDTALLGNGTYQLIKFLRWHCTGSDEWWAALTKISEWKEAGLIQPKCKRDWDEIEYITGSFRKKTTMRRLQLLAGPNGLFYYQVLRARKQWWSWNPK